MSFDLDKAADLDRARKITLGGRELYVAPLTLRKIKQASRIQLTLGEGTAEENIDRLIEFVQLGLSRTYPDLTVDDLLDSEATVPELTAAMEAIIEQAGGRKKDSSAGESLATGSQLQPGTSSSPSSALN